MATQYFYLSLFLSTILSFNPLMWRSSCEFPRSNFHYKGAVLYLNSFIYYPIILFAYSISLRYFCDAYFNFELISPSFIKVVSSIFCHFEGLTTVCTNYFYVVVSSIGEYHNYKLSKS